MGWIGSCTAHWVLSGWWDTGQQWHAKRYSSNIALGDYGHGKMVPLGSLTFRLSKDSLVVTISLGGTHGVDGWLLSCLFLNSESFKPLGFLKRLVVLACCKSVVPSTSLLKKKNGRTCRNQVACVVALENLQRAIILVLNSKYTNSAHTTSWIAWYRKIWLLEKCTAQQKQGFEFKVSWVFCLGGESSFSYAQN